MTSIEILKTRLDDAREKHHQLLTGALARVYVDQNGERVEYAATNASKLAAYINRLEQEIASLEGRPRPSRPMKARW